jgi:uncharacterized protein (TIGR02466 family)
MPIEGWFSTPIYFDKVQEPILGILQTDLDTAVAEFEKHNTFEHNSLFNPGTHRLSDTTFTKNFLEDYKLNSVITEIDKHIKLYVAGLGTPTKKIKEYKITTSWMTKFAPGECAHGHEHGSVDISGVFYYKTVGVFEGGRIQFQNPVTSMSTSWLYEHVVQSIDHVPEVGKILLFPGWLRHGVLANRSNEDRMSLSFNVVFKRY